MKRLPKVISLPGGRKIQVALVDDLRMAEIGGQDVDGLWVSAEKMIYIRKALPIARQWFVFSHEFNHATLDWQMDLINEGISKP